jgi:hypothetical protein
MATKIRKTARKAVAAVKKIVARKAPVPAPVKKPAVVRKAVTAAPRGTPVVVTRPTVKSDAKADRTIGNDELFDRIKSKAHELFVARGYNAGSDLGDWYKAEEIVKRELGIR